MKKLILIFIVILFTASNLNAYEYKSMIATQAALIVMQRVVKIPKPDIGLDAVKIPMVKTPLPTPECTTGSCPIKAPVAAKTSPIIPKKDYKKKTYTPTRGWGIFR